MSDRTNSRKDKAVTDTDWQGVIRLVVSVLAVALASIPAGLAVGFAWRCFLWASGA